MSWRVVVVSSNAKVDYKLEYLVVRTVDEVKRVHLSEVGVLMLESTAISLTTYLLCELVRRKIKVIVCDHQRNPCGELVPSCGCHDGSAKIRQQLQWDKGIRESVWTEIVREKLSRQKGHLARLASQIPVPVEYGEGDAVWPLLKGLKFQPVLDGVSPLERLTQYLELYHQLMPRPCVLLVGMHLYFSRQELEQFYQMALYEKWNVLVLEPYQCTPQPQEQWCIIDHDGCELRVDSPGEIP